MPQPQHPATGGAGWAQVCGPQASQCALHFKRKNIKLGTVPGRDLRKQRPPKPAFQVCPHRAATAPVETHCRVRGPHACQHVVRAGQAPALPECLEHTPAHAQHTSVNTCITHAMQTLTVRVCANLNAHAHGCMRTLAHAQGTRVRTYTRVHEHSHLRTCTHSHAWCLCPCVHTCMNAHTCTGSFCISDASGSSGHPGEEAGGGLTERELWSQSLVGAAPISPSPLPRGRAAQRICGWAWLSAVLAGNRRPPAHTPELVRAGGQQQEQPQRTPTSLTQLMTGLEPDGLLQPLRGREAQRRPTPRPPPAQMRSKRWFCLSPRIKGIQMSLAHPSAVGSRSEPAQQPRDCHAECVPCPWGRGKALDGASQGSNSPQNGGFVDPRAQATRGNPTFQDSCILVSHNTTLLLRAKTLRYTSVLTRYQYFLKTQISSFTS